MNKRIIVLLSVLFCVFFLFGFCFFNQARLPIRIIEKQILRDVKLGSDIETVKKYISKKNWELRWINTENGYVQKKSPHITVGSKYIRAFIGEYGIITTSVSVFFGFNENSELIAVEVFKEIDGL